MKVLQINSVCGIGSTGRIACDLDYLLKTEGHTSMIAFGRGEPRGCDTAIKIGSVVDTLSDIAKTRLLDLHGFGSTKATINFIQKIRQMDFDVIHLHNIHGYYINIQILFDFLKESEIPVIWTLHDCWAFTGHCAHFDYAGCEKWQTGCYDCELKGSYPKSIGRDHSEGNFKLKSEIFRDVKNLTIVTPSHWLANLVKQSFLGDYPIQVIPNGIDLDIFKPRASAFKEHFAIEEKSIILGVAANWDQRKGFDFFLELSKVLDEDQVIVLVGLDKRRINKLPPKIIGIEKTNDAKELAEIYTEATVFLNPTMEDTFPTTNLEALACGIPVLTFNTGGSIESVSNECGFVVEKNDQDAVIEIISTMKNNTSYFIPCRSRAERKYNKNDRFKEYINLYNITVNR